jgi:hypothetical protein
VLATILGSDIKQLFRLIDNNGIKLPVFLVML